MFSQKYTSTSCAFYYFIAIFSYLALFFKSPLKSLNSVSWKLKIAAPDPARGPRRPPGPPALFEHPLKTPSYAHALYRSVTDNSTTSAHWYSSFTNCVGLYGVLQPFQLFFALMGASNLCNVQPVVASDCFHLVSER